MSCPFKSLSGMTRRGFLTAAGGLVAATGVGFGARTALDILQDKTAKSSAEATIPFYHKYQAGIVTPQQTHLYFAAFEVTATRREEFIQLLQDWTAASARMSKGQSAQPLTTDLSKPAGDSGDAAGLGAVRLTLTFGFGPSLFGKDGHDRFGLGAQRPAALVDMPKFNGDQLVDAISGGDLCVQACADDAQVAFHAVRNLARIAGERATIRWAQTGFLSRPADGETPRNLMGFKDGTQQPKALEMDNVVWTTKNDGPAWMHDGSYLVTRKIRMALEHWDGTEVDFQEQVIGRHKDTGAPLGMQKEYDALDLDATDKDGNFIIAENAHARLGSAAANGGAQILRRGYSYNDGVNFVAERWPPWRQAIEYDAGLFFICYQRDPRSGFIKIFENMSRLDALNQFATHTSSALFACPRGAREGEYIGQPLFESA